MKSIRRRKVRQVSFFMPTNILSRKALPLSFCGILITVALFEFNNLQLNSIETLLRGQSTTIKNITPTKTSTITTLSSTLMGKHNLDSIDDEKILNIAVLGERHSGTTWIYEHLQECFEPHLKIHRKLTRYKHWFQYDDGLPHHKKLVLSLFRNPYHWIEAMRKIPHHASNHVHLNWRDFVTKTWTMERVGRDLNITNTTGRICQEKFKYNDVVSCLKYPYPDGYFKKRPVFSAHQPIYELNVDGSGEPYDNILELRTAKIKNFFDVIPNIKYVSDFWPFQYEELLQNGTAKLLHDIEDVTGVKANCKPSPPSYRKKRGLDEEFIAWINDHLDWDVEKLLGYNKMSNDTVNISTI